jgi:hypothetical protein
LLDVGRWQLHLDISDDFGSGASIAVRELSLERKRRSSNYIPDSQSRAARAVSAPNRQNLPNDC